MAEVFIPRDGTALRLPDLCVCCGAPAQRRDQFELLYVSAEIAYAANRLGRYSSTFATFSYFFQRRTKRRFPVCHRHHRQLRASWWLLRIGPAILIAMAAAFAACMLCLIAFAGLAEVDMPTARAFGLACVVIAAFALFGGVPLFAFWAFATLVFTGPSPQIDWMTESHYRVINVDPEFASNFNASQEAIAANVMDG
jgi:hypothetical protein